MSLFGDVHWTADEFIAEMQAAKRKREKMNPIVVLQQLEQLALAHPEVVAIIARTVDAAVNSTTPARAIVRHLVREAAEGASDELADELSKLTPVE